MHEIEKVLSSLADSVSYSLTKRNFGGFTLTLKVRYDDFSTITRSATYKTPIFTFEDIISLLPRLLGSTEAGRRKVRLLGISVSNLVDRGSTPYQLRLPYRSSLKP